MNDLITRASVLAHQAPPELLKTDLWKDRCRDIRNVESYLARMSKAQMREIAAVRKAIDGSRGRRV